MVKVLPSLLAGDFSQLERTLKNGSCRQIFFI